MERPKRATRKPVKYSEEETPKVKKTRKKIDKRIDKENVNPDEAISNRVTETTDKSEIVGKSRNSLKSKPTGKSVILVKKEKDQEESSDQRDVIHGTSVEDLLLGLNEVSVKDTKQPAIEPVIKNTSGKYQAEYSKTSRARCRLCQDIITKGSFRIGKMVHIDYGMSGGMGLAWWHMPCFFRQHSHYMKWIDFKGVEVLSVEDQKTLHEKACRCPMPNDMVEKVTSVLQAVQMELQEEDQQRQVLRAEEAARKRQDDVARREAVIDSSAEDVIRNALEKVIGKKTVEELKNIVKNNGIVVKRGTSGGKKSQAPRKVDYQNAIIYADPLSKVGSLVQRAIRKHVKVDELKILLEKAGLSQTGTKPVLAKRLLGTFGGDFGEESEEETTSKARRRRDDSFGFDDFYITNHDMYEKDEDDPDIVTAARDGNLDLVKEILKKTIRPIATINSSRKWTEVEEKWGYDKSWEWHGETPLLAACRNCHNHVVRYLLLEGADPTLEGCISDDVYESPMSAINKQISITKNELEKIRADSLSFCHSSVKELWRTPESVAKSILLKLKKKTIIKDLLDAAAPFWSTASYASSRYSKARQTSFARQPNKASNLQQLQIAVNAVSEIEGLDTALVNELSEGIKKARIRETERQALEMQKKKQEMERRKIEKERQRQELEKRLRLKEEEERKRAKLLLEEKERIRKEFIDKVRAVAPQVNIDTGGFLNTKPHISNLPFITTTDTQINKSYYPDVMSLADTDDTYEGSMVNWKGSFGFVKLDSPNWVPNIFVHCSDILSDRYKCRPGARLQFKLTKSFRKAGTLQAVKVSIVN